jgi:hypothetical protein
MTVPIDSIALFPNFGAANILSLTINSESPVLKPRKYHEAGFDQLSHISFRNTSSWLKWITVCFSVAEVSVLVAEFIVPTANL